MKRKPKEKTLYDLNFRYDCKIDYETYYPCHNGSDCCKDDYCRCGEIHSATVVKAPKMEDVLQEVALVFGFKSEIDLYGCERLLTLCGARNESFYYVLVCGGYYGQEIEGVKFTNCAELEAHLRAFAALSSMKDKVEYLLIVEYDYVLDSAKDKTWKIKSLNRDKVKFGNQEYYRKLQKNVLMDYEDYPFAKGICLKEGNNYRLIDGYHRMTADGSDMVSMIVGE